MKSLLQSRDTIADKLTLTPQIKKLKNKCRGVRNVFADSIALFICLCGPQIPAAQAVAHPEGTPLGNMAGWFSVVIPRGEPWAGETFYWLCDASGHTIPGSSHSKQ